MKAKDLMVGDYIRTKQGIATVVSVWEKAIYAPVGDEVVELQEGEFEEIPLTPWILEKNGWECFDTYHKYSHYRHPKAPFGILWRKEGGCTIEFKADESGGLAFLFILYVHQLQHALRLCEIEKEIEL